MASVDVWAAETGRVWVWPSSAVRAAEATNSEATGPGFRWMKDAAAAVAAAVRRVAAGQRCAVLLLVGGGNNGGDALFAGARLAGRGWPVRAVVLTDSPHVDALAAARAAGVDCVSHGDLPQLGDGVDDVVGSGLGVERPLVVVDGVCGVGVSSGGLRGPAAAWAQWCAARPDVSVVSVDVPSGVVPDDGAEPVGTVMRADVTVACLAVMRCHVQWPAAGWCGHVVWADVAHLCDGAHRAGVAQRAGVNRGVEVVQRADALETRRGSEREAVSWGCYRPVAATFTSSCAARVWPVPDRHSHKFSRGVVGMVVGSAKYRGAAVLSVRAALAAGVGMVVCVADEPVATDVVRECPEAVVVSRQHVAKSGILPRADVWLAGPGVDLDEAGTHDVLTKLWESPVALVVDASALRWLGARQHGARRAATVLTPHAGELQHLTAEFGSLVGAPVEQQSEQACGTQSTTPSARVTLPENARDVSIALSCPELRRTELSRTDSEPASSGSVPVVVVKGAPTTVVQAGMPDLVIEPECPWLATAGSGDVLAGLTAAVLTGTGQTQEAAAAAVWVHAAAGRHVSAGGPLRASDIIAGIGPAVRQIVAAQTGTP